MEEDERRMSTAIRVRDESKKALNRIFISPWQLHDDRQALPVIFVDLSFDNRALNDSLLAMLCKPSCSIYSLHSSSASRCRSAL